MSYNPNVPNFDNIAYDDLQKMRENFQILADIATRREDILSLAVETGDILDSRIVEHNLNILSPSNGYYIRWENGLQVCWGSVDIGPINIEFGTNVYISAAAIWNYPSLFSANPSVSGVVMRKEDVGGLAAYISGNMAMETTRFRFYGTRSSSSSDDYIAYLLAVGRWK